MIGQFAADLLFTGVGWVVLFVLSAGRIRRSRFHSRGHADDLAFVTGVVFWIVASFGMYWAV